MKIIDLLLKMANGEKLPKKIKYRDNIWEYISTVKGRGYQYYNTLYLEWETLQNQVYLEECLNDEVEIIDEPKKIKKLKTYKEKEGEDYFANILKLSPYSECKIDEALSTTIDKLNELIDAVNELKEQK